MFSTPTPLVSCALQRQRQTIWLTSVLAKLQFGLIRNLDTENKQTTC